MGTIEKKVKKYISDSNNADAIKDFIEDVNNSIECNEDQDFKYAMIGEGILERANVQNVLDESNDEELRSKLVNYINKSINK